MTSIRLILAWLLPTATATAVGAEIAAPCGKLTLGAGVRVLTTMVSASPPMVRPSDKDRLIPLSLVNALTRWQSPLDLDDT